MITEAVESTTPYMLRADGELLPCGDAHPYIRYYFDYSDKDNLSNLMDKHPESLDWYYNNTLSDNVRVLIDILKANPTDLDAYNELDKLCNEEFCKVRTSNMRYKYGGDNGEIYFRLCSDKVNWFPLIWDTIALYAPDTKYVTIVWDYQTFGKQYDYCKLNGQEMRHIPADEFLTLPGDPIIERRK